MRIISKFHDYYDGVQNYGGNDKSIIFKRLREEKEITNLNEFKCNDTIGGLLCRHRYFQCYYNGRKISVNQDFNIIGFAGRLYSVSQVYYYSYVDNGKYSRIVPMTAYNYDEYISKMKKFIEIKKGRRSKKNNSRYTERFDMKKFFIFDNDKFENQYDDIFVKYNTPIFSISDIDYRGDSIRYLLIINPDLEYYHFYKMFDAFSAFQEIEMYTNSALVAEKSLPNIPQEYRFEEKGFDNKISFRKEKSKKK